MGNRLVDRMALRAALDTMPPAASPQLDHAEVSPDTLDRYQCFAMDVPHDEPRYLQRRLASSASAKSGSYAVGAMPSGVRTTEQAVAPL